ncbi:MAG: hypothetical protein M3Q97_04900 [Bacteroidota bacterium]|nr:hypothetical protein [Bacteroidota bacterium]
MLDGAKPGISYSGSFPFISGNYAVLSGLPFLYRFPAVQKIDLTPVLSYILGMAVSGDSSLPFGMNLAGVWNNKDIVKILFWEKDHGFYCITLLRDMEVYEIASLSSEMLPPFKNIRQVGFDDKGSVVMISQEGRNHVLWRVVE